MNRFLPLIVLLVMVSCFDQNDCIITSTNMVKIVLETRAGVTQTASFIYVKQDSVGTNGDSSLHFPTYEKTSAFSTLQLPLDPSATKTYYSFLTSDNKLYHLGLEYSTYTRVISTECGAYLYYDNLKVIPVKSVYKFDSTVVSSPQLFQSVSTNLKLLF